MLVHIHRYEKLWLIIGTSILFVFLTILAVQTIAMGLAPPSHVETIDPEKVRETAPFDEPGIEQIGEKEYVVTMIAMTFGFDPGEIEIPVGSTVHFHMTSPDVTHAIQVPNTNINAMIMPGYISKISHTFNKKGEFLMLCNEYCGTGHHFMMGTIIVN